jgi:hypothetical protein
VEAVVSLPLQTVSTPFIGSYVVDLRGPIVEMGRVIVEKIAPPALEIVAAVLPPQPIAAMAPATGVKAVLPVQRTVAAARLQPPVEMGPATAERIVRHVHKTAQAHIRATIALLQPGRPPHGWNAGRHVEL